jgi:hypothetical protein
MEKKSKSAEKRWVAYVKKCEQLKTFDCYAVRKEYGVDARLINTLVELGWVISSKRGKYNWIWQYPLTEKDINTFINTHRQYIKKYYPKVAKVDRLKFEVIPLRAKYDMLDSKVDITEEQAIERLRQAGGYEIYKVERKSII